MAGVLERAKRIVLVLAGPNVNTGKVVGQAPGERLNGEPLAGEMARQNEGHAGRLGLEAGVEVRLAGYQAIATDTATNGEIIDLQDVGMVDFVAMIADFTDGDYAFKIQHGDDSGLSDAADVDATDQIRGNLYNEAITPSEDNRVYRWQLLKFKRYARLVVTSDNTSTGTLLSASAELNDLRGSLNNDLNVA